MAGVASIAGVKLLLLVTAATLAATTAARAERLIISIRGDACDLSALDAELTQMLADKPVGGSRVSVVTHIGNQTLSAEVLFVEAEGQTHGPRLVTASSCDDLFDSIALVIVMALPDAAVHEPADPRDASELETATTPMLPATPHPLEPPAPTLPVENLAIARSASAEAPRVLAIDGYISGASTVTSRGLNEQLLLGVRLKRGRASLSLQAHVDAPEEVRVTATGKIVVTHVDASVAPCVHIKSFAGCALVGIGVLRGSGEALHSARDTFTPVLATGLRIGWEHFLTSNLAVRVHVDGRALLTTTTFDVDYMPVWESGRFEGSAGVGLLARFL